MDKPFTCPYSGAEQVIYFETNLRNPGWRVAGGFDPALPFLDQDSAFRGFRTRNGVRDAVKIPMCPYTGKAITVVKRHGLWYGEGDFFRPMAPAKSEEHLSYDLQLRMGRAPKGVKKPVMPTVEIGETLEKRSDPVADILVRQQDTKQLLDHAIEGIFHDEK